MGFLKFWGSKIVSPNVFLSVFEHYFCTYNCYLRRSSGPTLIPLLRLHRFRTKMSKSFRTKMSEKAPISKCPISDINVQKKRYVLTLKTENLLVVVSWRCWERPCPSLLLSSLLASAGANWCRSSKLSRRRVRCI